jgi:hypothetical protein
MRLIDKLKIYGAGMLGGSWLMLILSVVSQDRDYPIHKIMIGVFLCICFAFGTICNNQ